MAVCGTAHIGYDFLSKSRSFTSEKNLANRWCAPYISARLSNASFGVCHIVRFVGDTCVTKPCTQTQQHDANFFGPPTRSLPKPCGRELAMSHVASTLDEGILIV